jgi:hypothetical protein
LLISSTSKLNKFWYISFNHTTEKDKDHGAKVMKKWNAIRGKNSMGYLSRMKHSVNLKSFDVLEISNINLKHLKEFNQGKNSNGKPIINDAELVSFVLCNVK